MPQPTTVRRVVSHPALVSRGQLAVCLLAIGLIVTLKGLGVEKTVVVGHDIGLIVAYAYAAQFPAETEKLDLTVSSTRRRLPYRHSRRRLILVAMPEPSRG